MGMTYPDWANTDQLRNYYDTEWGRPVRSEQGLYERICLEAFQVGLSWALILARRSDLQKAFDGFDPDVVADYTDADVERILAAPGVIKNKQKIRACITNARATIALRDAEGLPDLIWSYQPPHSPCESAPEAAELAKALKKHGFTFVGPTTCFALMEACGLVDNRIHE